MFRRSALFLALACGSLEETHTDKRQGAAVGLTGTCPRESSSGLWESAVEAPIELVQLLNRDMPRGLSVRAVSGETSVGASHYDFRYESDEGIPLCERVVRAHQIGDQRLIDGQIPSHTLPAVVSLEGLQWHDADQTAAAAARSLGIIDQAIEVTSADRCFLLNGDQAAAAWELQFRVGQRRFSAVANGKRITKVASRDLHVTGSAKVFDSGPQDGKLVDVAFDDLLPGDSLSTARFRSEVISGPAARETSLNFDYEPTDPRFAEVSAFAHVAQMAQWLVQPEHHYQIDCVPITIKTHVIFTDPDTGEKTKNNAQYMTPDPKRGGYPEIWVGDGDGQVLKDIALDFDTVAHELGHHVIYRKLTDTDGPSAVLHEGLADFMVFAKTGNACIGESICPMSSGACEVRGKCLRTGENTLNFEDPNLPRDAHSRSQLVSGMLWDLGQKKDIGLAAMASVVIKGIDYLLPSSDYDDLVKALMAADLELFDGVHSCAIKAEAVQRGFGDLVSSLDCKDYEKTRQ